MITPFGATSAKLNDGDPPCGTPAFTKVREEILIPVVEKGRGGAVGLVVGWAVVGLRVGAGVG